MTKELSQRPIIGGRSTFRTGTYQRLIGVAFAIFLLSRFPADTIQRTIQDNCKSEKLREIILETIGHYPHQYSYQARHMKQVAESRFGNWWSAVIISERGGYGMSAIYDQHQNTSCEIMLFDTFYWLGRTC